MTNFITGWLKLAIVLPAVRIEKWPVKPDPSKGMGWGFA